MGQFHMSSVFFLRLQKDNNDIAAYLCKRLHQNVL